MLRRSSLWRLTAVSAMLLAFAATAFAQPDVRLADDTALTINTATLLGRLPVLFVHGHNRDDAQDADFNYRQNWQDAARPSFKQTLERPENQGLRIEAYYIRFMDQARSITEDARDIGEAIELILHRHDPNYVPNNSQSRTHVQVAIIAYSKGTISTRQYLKSLQTQVEDLPAPRVGFRPVSEFIAISPPNHGISTPLFAGTDQLSGKQLYNGFRPEVGPITAAILGVPTSQCSDSFNDPAATNYISTLNNHPITDSISIQTGENYPDEAPGSREDGRPPTEGTLYVTLFAHNNRDFVGGLTPSTDCPQNDGRRLARNFSNHAINIEVPEIDGSLPATVHGNSVHTSEVICKALYAAVHHRSPLNATCSPDDLPIIPPPPLAAAVLSLDFSGSMTALVGPNRSRADELKQSVELFIRLWSEMGGASDRIGVNYFRTDVERYDLGGDHLPLLSDAANDLIDKVGRQDPNNSTAMGGGLQWAIETLNGATNTPIRRVILFTDGMQNVNPMVRPVGGHHEIRDDGTNRPDSNVTPTNLRLDQLGGIKVDTIGIGTSPTFVGLLRDIAFETGGQSWPTADPAMDLRRFFVEVLINALRGFSPQLVAYRHGLVASKGNSEAFVVEDGGKKLLLKVSWKRGDPIDFTVAKDGVDVSSSGRFIKGEFYKIFVVDFSAKGAPTSRGRWELRLKGRKGMAYETAAIVDGNRIKYDGLFEVKSPKIGDELDLVVRLTSDGEPIPRDARVTVKLRRPTTKALNFITAHRPKELPTFEPGLTIPERRLLALPMDRKTLIALKPSVQTATLKATEKGEFRGRFRALVPGIYTAVVTIEGEDAKVGKFSRTLTASTVVRSAR